MGLTFEVLLTVGLVASFALNAWAIRRVSDTVGAIDEDATQAFCFVGDKLGTVLARVNAVESILADEADEDAAEETAPFGTFVSFDEAQDLPVVFGVDFATGPDRTAYAGASIGGTASVSANDTLYFPRQG